MPRKTEQSTAALHDVHVIYSAKTIQPSFQSVRETSVHHPPCKHNRRGGTRRMRAETLIGFHLLECVNEAITIGDGLGEVEIYPFRR